MCSSFTETTLVSYGIVIKSWKQPAADELTKTDAARSSLTRAGLKTRVCVQEKGSEEAENSTDLPTPHPLNLVSTERRAGP